MKCGCSYELFMHLNPHRLEPFFESNRLKIDEQLKMQENYAWLQGMFNRQAVVSALNKNVRYPRNPWELIEDSHNKKDDLTDGQKFALFMVKHNKARKNRA
jgi:hypothetical protein